MLRGKRKSQTNLEGDKNCSDFLQKKINLINPKIIATLGAVALEALKTIEYHQFALRLDAAKILRRNRRLLVALYHPSPQVFASHRRAAEQLADFGILKQAIEKVRTAQKNKEFRVT
ncbi:MAG TPA: uracil-DNA glycosylase family protein [Pyrinomonadaceae bacterium]